MTCIVSFTLASLPINCRRPIGVTRIARVDILNQFRHPSLSRTIVNSQRSHHDHDHISLLDSLSHSSSKHSLRHRHSSALWSSGPCDNGSNIEPLTYYPSSRPEMPVAVGTSSSSPWLPQAKLVDDWMKRELHWRIAGDLKDATPQHVDLVAGNVRPELC
jgi:hypothetical protein